MQISRTLIIGYGNFRPNFRFIYISVTIQTVLILFIIITIHANKLIEKSVFSCKIEFLEKNQGTSIHGREMGRWEFCI